MGNIVFFVLGVLVGLWARSQRLHHLIIVPPPRPPDADEMTNIKGIGPAFANALHDLGIRTYAQLARQNADDLAQRLGAIGRASVTSERIRRERWIEQASDLARNESRNESRS